MKLLLVEDEASMARLLLRGLSEEGHQVDVCARGEEALRQAVEIAYDVVLLDWSLPDLDGVSVLRRWREQGLGTPVLMLTARGSTGEKVTGLRAGADDYLVKPFDFDELLARLEALARRGNGGQATPSLGGVALDGRRRALVCGAREAALTAREFALASELWHHPGDVLSRSRLLSAVWGSDFEGLPNVVDVYVGYLRAKLEHLGATGVEIAAVRGIGYRLKAAAA
ncbi:MAG: response regulator transcription factor [Myxococcaceae bacterium]|nr:response regulator transcription factor [Myxococcaceae bacterium]